MARPAEDWGRLADAANECEADVWHAIQRAKSGQAMDGDWQLIEWACGFTHSAPRQLADLNTEPLPF